MTNHTTNRLNTRRALRVAILCAGVLVLGACSGNTPEATGGDENASTTTTGDDALTQADPTIDAETVKDALRNALEGPVRVTGVDSVDPFAVHVDETGNWWARSPLGAADTSSDETRSEFRYINGEFYTLSADYTADGAGSFVWVRSNTSPAGTGVKFTAEMLQASLLLGIFDNSGPADEPGPEWLDWRDYFLDEVDISFDQVDGWMLTSDDSWGDTYSVRVVLDDAGRLVSLWNVKSSFSLLYDRYTGVTPIEAPETHLEGETAMHVVLSEALARTTQLEAEAMGRNTSAIAASTGNGDVLDKHFEAAWDEAGCRADDSCSFDLTTKTFSLTQQDYTCSTTFLIDEYQYVTVTDPVCSKN